MFFGRINIYICLISSPYILNSSSTIILPKNPVTPVTKIVKMVPITSVVIPNVNHGNISNVWSLIADQKSPPVPNIKFPVGYKICLSSTPLAESNYLELQNSGKPGIYVLHAIPNVTNARYLPMRKIFCRPKPYC